MSSAAPSTTAAAPADGLSECEQALARLRLQGAHHCQPVDFCFMEAMARRMAGQAPHVRRILEAKLAQALAAYPTSLTQAPSDAFAAAHHQAPTATPLGQLVSAMAQHPPEAEPGHWALPNGSRAELKSVRHFRNTWAKLSAQKQVIQALEQAPQNAGPINSHMLVLRSLELMRDISPDYLNRFLSYADTLLCLDQPDPSAKTAARKTAAVKGASRAKPASRK